MNKIYRAMAPLRLGLGGGGTDIPAYSSQFGGAIINATINMYAHVSLEPIKGKNIEFISHDRNLSVSVPCSNSLELAKGFEIHCGVYNRMVSQYKIPAKPFRMYTHVDAPPGSGLGSSSTLIVSMIGALAEWHNLPLGDYEVAETAFNVERVDLDMSGGKQDQFAATFGGFNFMEFNRDGSVLINPLRVKDNIIQELETQCLLIYTKISRFSSQIIDDQINAIQTPGQESRMLALHEVKKGAYRIKAALLRGDFTKLGKAMHEAWLQKKSSASHISTAKIDEFYQIALDNGALGGKVSGAGGGGFMFLICPSCTRFHVEQVLLANHAQVAPFRFCHHGLKTWSF